MFGRGTPTATPSFGDAYDRRRNNFDVLRFGLAASVIWSHCYALAGRPMDPVFALTHQIDAGSLAVQAFFVLSGFLITQSWIGDPDLRDYTVKRALRLVPALLAALVFGALVVGPLMTTGPVLGYLTASSTWAHFDGVALHRHLASPFLFGDNPVPHQLNASLWSLRYEMLCYGLVALIGLWSGARWTVVTPLVLATALVAQVVLGRFGAPPAGVATTLDELVGCFFAGAAAALVAAGLVGGLRVVFPLAGTYLLLFAGCWRGLPLQGFGRYGDFSYGLYVFAYPIQQAIVQHAGTGISIPVFFVLAFVATLVLAILSWHFIEAPSLARKPRRAPVRVTAPSCPTGAAWPVTSPGGS